MSDGDHLACLVIYTKTGVRLIEMTPRASVVGVKAHDFRGVEATPIIGVILTPNWA